jgi:hypothetical protein
MHISIRTVSAIIKVNFRLLHALISSRPSSGPITRVSSGETLASSARGAGGGGIDPFVTSAGGSWGYCCL